MSPKLPLILLLLAVASLHAEDWPQFRGVNRDGRWHETGRLPFFPPGGLPVRWRRPVGFSWATPVVSQGRVFVADAELKKPDAKERLHCFDEATGKTLWMFSYDVKYPDGAFVPGQGNGPTATPIVEGDRIWMLGLNGEVHCLETSSGAVLWEKALNREFKIADMVCRPSPLIEGNLLILFTGASPDAAVIALDKHNGNMVWKALNEPVLNSSPIVITVSGQRQLVVWTGESVVALDPATGTTLWAERLITSSNDGNATPVFHNNRLLISGLMFEFRDGRTTPQILWPVDTKAVAKRVLSNTSTPLFRDDHIYSALSRGQFGCLDAATGKELWQTDKVTKPKSGASIHITVAGDAAYLFTDEGTLILARLTPAGYQEISRAHAIDPTTPFGGQNKAWTPPSYANGHVFVRNDDDVVCLSLTEEK
jgi:outer membrane protein assembly factor BamB